MCRYGHFLYSFAGLKSPNSNQFAIGGVVFAIMIAKSEVKKSNKNMAHSGRVTFFA